MARLSYRDLGFHTERWSVTVSDDAWRRFHEALAPGDVQPGTVLACLVLDFLASTPEQREQLLWPLRRREAVAARQNVNVTDEQWQQMTLPGEDGHESRDL